MILLNIFRLAIQKEFFLFSKGDLILFTYFIVYFIGAYFIAISDKSLKVKNIPVKMPSNFAVYTCLSIVLIYWLKNIKVLQQAIFNPRMFYASTRIGGGLIYFIIIPISILLYYMIISHIRYNSEIAKPNLKSILITFCFFAYLYIFGRKANMLNIIFVFLFTLYYANYNINRERHINKITIKYIFIFGCILVVVFGLYFKQQGMSTDRIFMRFVNYSDYLKNFNELVKNLSTHFWGKLFIENEFYSYIPRFIWKSKPELFGSLTLGLYVPTLKDWTLSMTGAPSFGPLGQVYADFGLIGIPIKLFLEWCFLSIARAYELKLEKDGYNFFHQWLLMSFCGIKIFSVTLTTFPLYELVVIFVFYNISKIKIRSG